jgi:hypothetical protein
MHEDVNMNNKMRFLSIQAVTRVCSCVSYITEIKAIVGFSLPSPRVVDRLNQMISSE